MYIRITQARKEQKKKKNATNDVVDAAMIQGDQTTAAKMVTPEVDYYNGSTAEESTRADHHDSNIMTSNSPMEIVDDHEMVFDMDS